MGDFLETRMNAHKKDDCSLIIHVLLWMENERNAICRRKEMSLRIRLRFEELFVLSFLVFQPICFASDRC